MPVKDTADPKFDIGHVLFMDVVGYSKLLSDEQRELQRQLNEVVRNTNEFRAAEADGKLVRLPSGDGMALVFFNNPEAPVQCALEISQALRNSPELQLRMGIHSGPVSGLLDVNDRSGVAGAGINMAQRVMDCGDAGHILLSKRTADDLAEYRLWKSHLHDLGECEVKHGVRISLVNLYTNDAGNPGVPGKLEANAPPKDLISGAISLAKNRRVSWRLVGAVLLLATVLVVSVIAVARVTRHSIRANGSAPTYAKTSYERAKWSKIYGADRLFPTKAAFQKVESWNRKNLAITGTIDGDKLFLVLQNGEWEINKIKKVSRYDAIFACAFVDAKRLVTVAGYSNGLAELGRWEGDGYHRLGEVPLGSSLYVLAPNLYCGMEPRTGYWKYTGDAVQRYDQATRESFVLKEENTVAQFKRSSNAMEPLLVANVSDVTVLFPGNALGLWSVASGNVATVRYRDGRWYLMTEVAGFSPRNVPNKAWFVDEKNFVAIGTDKVARCIEGNLTLQTVQIEGQEYSAKELRAVWGHDLKNYWTADRAGNVFSFDGTQWKLTVRGPKLKPSQKFEGLSTARDGTVVGITTDEVYVLE
jgi:Adenylate and Guanylate cyclase catalytic domain